MTYESAFDEIVCGGCGRRWRQNELDELRKLPLFTDNGDIR
jgi:hypothetical protein